jgi:RNA polymerase sigma-70 factor (sigma-E family)
MSGGTVHAKAGAIRLEGGVLADLYAREAGEALRLAYLLTGDGSLAEDLVQDAFVKLAGRLLHVRDPGGFRAYLRKTIVNLARSYFRRRAVERRYLEGQAEPPAFNATDLSDRDATRRALMQLPVRQRTAVVLRYLEDLSEAETADLMRCRQAAVKSLVSRGTSTLRATLGEEL